MQLVPIVPETVFGVKDGREVKGVAAVKRSTPVQERTLPPLVSHGRELSQAVSEINRSEKREETELEERRLVCRRIQRQSLLEELRSAIDRRRYKQRSTDIQLHIDEEV